MHWRTALASGLLLLTTTTLPAVTPHDEPLYYQAMTSLGSDEYGEAAEDLETLLRTHPGDARHWLYLAYARAGMGEFDAALSALEFALEAGFSDSARVRNIGMFDTLATDTTFVRITHLMAERYRDRPKEHAIEQTRLASYWVRLPEGYGSVEGDWPVLVVFHGGGSNRRGAEELLDAIGDVGAVALYANGMYDFPIPGHYRHANRRLAAGELQQRGDELIGQWSRDILADAAQEYSLDTNRVVFMGFSAGGVPMWSSLLTLPEQALGMGLFGTVTPDGLAERDLSRVQERGTEFLLLRGSEDRVATEERYAEVEKLLDSLGLSWEQEVFPEVGHDFTDAMGARAHRWLEDLFEGE